MLHFEWGPQKASSNHARHEESFHEAVSVFSDPLSVTVLDPTAESESRYVLLGMSVAGRRAYRPR